MINSNFDINSPYYNHVRLPLLNLARNDVKRVLEIGCAAGQSLAYLKAKGADYLVGIELVPEVSELARQRPEIDRVIVGNVENLELDFEPNSFDLIIAGHVLEHVTDPWAVLRKIRPFLKHNGQLIGSLPNVRHYSVVFPLLFRGRWDYKSEGILDWTHFRFFTKKTVRDLLIATEFGVDSIVGEIAGRKATLANALTLGLACDLWAFTNNFSATKI